MKEPKSAYDKVRHVAKLMKRLPNYGTNTWLEIDNWDIYRACGDRSIKIKVDSGEEATLSWGAGALDEIWQSLLDGAIERLEDELSVSMIKLGIILNGKKHSLVKIK